MWLTHDDDALKAIAELENSSDRAVGVIAGAIIDAQISATVRNCFHRDDSDYSKKIRKSIFHPDGALGSFGSKVGIAYLMGLFSKDAHADLMNIAKVRNLFAHYAEHSSFDTENVRDLCANFKIINFPDKVNDELRFEPADDPSKGFFHEAFMTGPDGPRIFIKDRTATLKSSKGRFLTTAKLFCGAMHNFTKLENRPPLPIL